MQPLPSSPAEPILVSVGDISCTAHEVLTPAGRFPLRGTTWVVRDSSRVEERIPPVAIVLAILFFIFCLLGLLFLLMKEKRVTGYVEVSVQGPGGLYHLTQLPAGVPGVLQDAHSRVDYIRGLAAYA